MLILTRKVDEEIMIGDGIIVRVLEVRGKQIRLGVVAPREQKIHRREVWERIQEEAQQGKRGSQ